MEVRPVRDGVAGFIADLADFGINAVADGAVVKYEVTAVGGALSGHEVPTAVSASELQPWPAAPPHWIHLPDALRFERTNTDQQEVLPGWRRHSRDIGHWNSAGHPGQRWLAHVRRVMSEIAA
jgi:hypothetical protein